MFEIIICEDNPAHLEAMVTYVKNYLVMEEDLPIRLALATPEAAEVVAYARQTSARQDSLYFIDVRLGEQMSGLDLARKLRRYQPQAKLVFVTAYEEYLPFTMTYHLEALDYILKDDSHKMRDKIIACIQTAYERSLVQAQSFPPFVIRKGAQTQVIRSAAINFFETLPAHRIRLVGPDALVEFYDSFKNIEADYPQFVRCHRSYLANVENIQELDSKERQLTFIDGSAIPFSRERYDQLVEAMANYSNQCPR